MAGAQPGRKLSLAGLLALASACSPAPTAVEPAVAVATTKGPQLTVETSVGAMSEHEAEQAFAALQPAVARCVEQGAARQKGLGGELTLALRIAGDGSVDSAYMAASTVGDRQTEKCILAEAVGRSWPRPVGGPGLARHSYAVDPEAGVPVVDGRRLHAVKLPLMKTIARCTWPLGGRWQLTLYVRYDGRITSAGVAPPSAAAEQHADCVAERLTKLRLKLTQRPLVKVTFTVP